MTRHSSVLGNVQRGHEEEGGGRGGRCRNRGAGAHRAFAPPPAPAGLFAAADAFGPASVAAAVFENADFGAGGEASEVRQPRKEVLVLRFVDAHDSSLHSKIPQHRVTGRIINE